MGVACPLLRRSIYTPLTILITASAANTGYILCKILHTGEREGAGKGAGKEGLGVKHNYLLLMHTTFNSESFSCVCFEQGQLAGLGWGGT